MRFFLFSSSSSLILDSSFFSDFYHYNIITFSTNAFSSCFLSSIFFFRIISLCSNNLFFLSYAPSSSFFSWIFNASISFDNFSSSLLKPSIDFGCRLVPITRGGRSDKCFFGDYDFLVSAWLIRMASSSSYYYFFFNFSSSARDIAIAFSISIF